MTRTLFIVLLMGLPWNGSKADEPSASPTSKTGYVIVQRSQVERPILLEYKPDLTIMSAMGSAGDFTIFSLSSVRLVRWDGKMATVNLKKLRAHPEEDLKLMPGDILQVLGTIF